MYSILLALLFFASLLSGCTLHLQNQLDEQKQYLQQIDKSLRRYQADSSSEFDKIRREIQIIKGTLDENSHHAQQDITELKARIDKIIIALKKKQGQLDQLQKNYAATDAKTDTPSAPAVSSPSDEQTMYDRAYGDFKNGRYQQARVRFEKFLKTYPKSDLADNALYWIGNSFFKEKNFKESITAFEDVIKKFPRGNKVPDAYYLQALAFYELQDQLTAQILLETVIQNFPASQAASLAQKKHAEIK